MNKFLKIALVLGLMLVLVGTAYSTNRTTAYTRYNVQGYTWLRFQITTVAPTDTAIMPFSLGKATIADSVARLNIYTTSLNGDSVDISVRWQGSSDNVNWVTTPLGTDSTTWVSALTGANANLNTFLLGPGSYGGHQPYNRVLIITNPGSNVGGKVKVDVIEP